MSILVTATGTGVGKTFFSALFMLKYGIQKNWYYWKYLETGSVRESDYYCLKKTLGNKNIFPPIYRFSLPASPHYSAKLENKKIDVQKLKTELKKNLGNHKILLEGAGGVLVPLTNHFLSIELWKDLELLVIVVAATTLGTINHTLLTLEALKNRNIEVLGFYMIGEKTNLLSSNLETIQKFSKTKCLGVTILPKRKLKKIELEKFAQKNFDTSQNLKSIL